MVPASALGRLRGIRLPTTIAKLIAAFGEPDRVDLPDQDDPSPWGQWFRWGTGAGSDTFTALAAAYDPHTATRRAGVSFIEVRANRQGRVTPTLLGLKFHRSRTADVAKAVGGALKPSVLTGRSELGAGRLYSTGLKIKRRGLWTYFFFDKGGRLVGVLQAQFDVDGAD